MNYITCPCCGQSLPETSFYKASSRKTGRRVYCKACEADMNLQWRVETGKTKAPYSANWDPHERH